MSALLELDFSRVQSQEVSSSISFIRDLIEAGADRETFSKISRLGIDEEIILPQTWRESETGEEIPYVCWRATRSSFCIRGNGGYHAGHIDDTNLTSDLHSPWETAAQLFLFCGSETARAVRLEHGTEMTLADGNMVRRVVHGWHMYRVDGEMGYVAGQATLPQELGRREFAEMFRGSWSTWKRLYYRRVRHIVDGLCPKFEKGYAGFYEPRPGFSLPDSLDECWQLMQEIPDRESIILNRYPNGDVRYIRIERSSGGTWGGLFVGTWRPGGPAYPAEKIFTDPDATRRK